MSTNTLYDKGHSYQHFDSPSTMLIRAGEVRLRRVTINNPDTSGSIAIYNGLDAGGELVILAAADANAHTGTLDFDIVLNTGLTVVITASPDITVVYD